MEKNNSSGYYDDMDVEVEMLLKNGMVEEVFYLKDLKQRKLFLSEDICQETVEDAVRHIMQFNREDAEIPPEERKPILLYLNSNGGDVDAGFMLIDIILASKTPVYTINLGYQYSMGFLIGLAGHKRYATINAKFLHHDGTNVVVNSGAKVKDQMKFQDKVEARIKEYVLSRTQITPAEYDKRLRQEWYLFAADAKKYGMVDFIVREDCSIDAIV